MKLVDFLLEAEALFERLRNKYFKCAILSGGYDDWFTVMFSDIHAFQRLSLAYHNFEELRAELKKESLYDEELELMLSRIAELMRRCDGAYQELATVDELLHEFLNEKELSLEESFWLTKQLKQLSKGFDLLVERNKDMGVKRKCYAGVTRLVEKVRELYRHDDPDFPLLLEKLEACLLNLEIDMLVFD